VLLFRADSSGPARRRGILGFFLFIVLQLYGGFYEGYFVCLAAAIGFCWVLAVPGLRLHVLGILRIHWRVMLLAMAASAAALSPWFYHVISATREVGVRSVGEAVIFLPRLQSWFFISPGSFLYGWMDRLSIFHSIAEPKEHHLGLGLLTSCAAVAAWWRFRSHPVAKLVLACGLTLIVCFTYFPGSLRLWQIIYYVIPGLQAVRAPGRIILLMVIPIAAGLGFLHASAGSKRQHLLLTLLLLACCAEQFQWVPAYEIAPIEDRVSRLANLVDPHAAAFVILPAPGGQVTSTDQLDAMWASARTGVPTVNLYSGNLPRGWPLLHWLDRAEFVPTPTAQEQLRAYLQRHGADPSNIQFIEFPAR
jgi:hypothetical protein